MTVLLTHFLHCDLIQNGNVAPQDRFVQIRVNSSKANYVQSLEEITVRLIKHSSCLEAE